ncbi:unnamed protein product [Ranitomeya imitator]|uniref:Myosin-binding protein C, fast-type n=1 Tax=Ranitomeya imitator TaxID=111125 RepID=A0ABN9LM57_9NEOB|nr:unnamed protein product [Ranitomeya imitator]
MMMDLPGFLSIEDTINPDKIPPPFSEMQPKTYKDLPPCFTFPADTHHCTYGPLSYIRDSASSGKPAQHAPFTLLWPTFGMRCVIRMVDYAVAFLSLKIPIASYAGDDGNILKAFKRSPGGEGKRTDAGELDFSALLKKTEREKKEKEEKKVEPKKKEKKDEDDPMANIPPHVLEILRNAKPNEYEKIAFQHGITDLRGMLKHLKKKRVEIQKTDGKCEVYLLMGLGGIYEINTQVIKSRAFTRKLDNCYTVDRHQKIKIHVEVSNPDLPVKWMKNGQVIKPSAKYVFENIGLKRILTINKCTLADDAEYTCVVGDERCSTELFVKEPPVTIEKPLEDQQAFVGDKVELEVEVSEEGAQVVWTKDGIELTRDEMTKYRFRKDGKKHILIINETNKEDTGRYGVETNGGSCEADLVIEDKKLEVLQGIADLTVKAAEQAVFKCEVSDEKVTGRWLKNGVEIRPSKRITMSHKGRICGRLCPSLIGRGNLYDIIIAMATIMTSTSILCPLLIGRGLTASTNQTRDVYVLYDIIVAVPVVDWSRPPGNHGNHYDIIVAVPVVDWSRPLGRMATIMTSSSLCPSLIGRGLAASTNQRLCFRSEGVMFLLVESGMPDRIGIHKLVIDDVKPEDEADYTFVPDGYALSLSAKLNFLEVKIEYVPLEEPPKIHLDCSGEKPLNTITVVAGNKLRFDVPITGEPAPTVTWFKEDVEFTEIDGRVRIEPKPDLSSFVIEGAKREDEGNYKIVVTNPSGEDAAQLYVKVVDVPDPPENITIVGVGEDWADVVWDPPKYDGGQEILGYYIERKKKGSQRWMKMNFEAYTDTKYQSTNMIEGVLYEIRIFAVNAIGISQEASTTNPFMPIAPTSEPLHLTVEDVTDTTCTLKWRPPDRIGAGGIDGYLIEYCKEGTDEWIESNKELVERCGYTAKGLPTGEKLFFRVRAVNIAGKSEPATLGQPVTIREIGKPRPIVTWTKDGEPLDPKKVSVRTSESDTIIFIRSSERSHSGKYDLSVKIENMVDCATVNIRIVDDTTERERASARMFFSLERKWTVKWNREKNKDHLAWREINRWAVCRFEKEEARMLPTLSILLEEDCSSTNGRGIHLHYEWLIYIGAIRALTTSIHDHSGAKLMRKIDTSSQTQSICLSQTLGPTSPLSRLHCGWRRMEDRSGDGLRFPLCRGGNSSPNKMLDQ